MLCTRRSCGSILSMAVGGGSSIKVSFCRLIIVMRILSAGRSSIKVSICRLIIVMRILSAGRSSIKVSICRLIIVIRILRAGRSVLVLLALGFVSIAVIVVPLRGILLSCVPLLLEGCG